MREYAESRQPMDVVVTSAVLRVVAEDGTLRGVTHGVGDQLTVPRSEGESLIARGNARLA